MLLYKLWKNFGRITNGLYRSGQMDPLRLVITYFLLKPNLVIRLNGVDDWKDRFEVWFLGKRVRLIERAWPSSGPPEDLDDFWSVYYIMVSALDRYQRVWVHCGGGKDRTGGLVGIWLVRTSPVTSFIEQCRKHGVPSLRWTRFVLYG